MVNRAARRARARHRGRVFSLLPRDALFRADHTAHPIKSGPIFEYKRRRK